MKNIVKEAKQSFEKLSAISGRCVGELQAITNPICLETLSLLQDREDRFIAAASNYEAKKGQLAEAALARRSARASLGNAIQGVLDFAEAEGWVEVIGYATLERDDQLEVAERIEGAAKARGDFGAALAGTLATHRHQAERLEQDFARASTDKAAAVRELSVAMLHLRAAVNTARGVLAAHGVKVSPRSVSQKKAPPKLTLVAPPKPTSSPPADENGSTTPAIVNG